jgi:isopentenyl-diphosphate Delta-isomerase
MKVVILWLINERGEVLLSRRAVHMSTDANLWGPSVSGKVDESEKAEHAIIREAHEELGIQKADIIPICHLQDAVHRHSDGRFLELSTFFATVESVLIETMKLAPKEVASVKWISLQDLQKEFDKNPETIIISSDKTLWQSIFDNLLRVISGTINTQ